MMYLTSIELENTRCIRAARLTLRYPGDGQPGPDNINIILGANGSGKSTVLQAAATAVLKPIAPELAVTGMVHSDAKSAQATAHLIRAGGQSGEITAHWKQVGSYFELTHRAPEGFGLDALFLDDSPAFFLAGFGPYRPLLSPRGYTRYGREERAHESMRRDRVRNLVDSRYPLNPLENWLTDFIGDGPKANAKGDKLLAAAYRAWGQEIVDIVNIILPDDAQLIAKENQLLVQIHGRPLALNLLSDGYQSILGWVGHLLRHLKWITTTPGAKLADQIGTVLIDEIDLHMHPAWQRVIVGNIARAFPKLQFIMTTHSPLILGGVPHTNIHRMVLDERGDSHVERAEEATLGRSVDQLLSSVYFDHTPVRSGVFHQRIDELLDRIAAGDASASLEYFEHLARGVE